jgi:translation elongation factor aEF-1 beta
MASVVVTIKLMPKEPGLNWDSIYGKAQEKIRAFIDEKHRNGEMRKEIAPIGFGLSALKITFVMDEQIGGTEKLEENIKKIEGVESVETTDVRRAIG